MIRIGLKTLTVVAAAGVASAAQAQPANRPLQIQAIYGAKADKPALDLTDRRLFIGAARAPEAGAALVDSPNKTAIDHRFETPDLVGSLGYLCGLQPGPNESTGPASAYDPAGTFLGAQMKLAFR